MNENIFNQSMNRKTFILTLGRYLILAIIAALGINLLLNRKNKSVTFDKNNLLDSTCKASGICRNCRWLSNCTTPSALSYKNHLNGDRK